MKPLLVREPEAFGNEVYAIDLFEQGQAYRTASYLVLDEKPTLIDTGSAASHETLLESLKLLGVKPEDLAYVVVTHVHLDHAGGAGQMMRLAKNATLVAHPRAARHMADPSKLWAGAKLVYQDQTEQLFGSVEPVDEQRILIRQHGETLNIGQRTFTFFDSPGHAKHHFTLLDELSNALFAGDAVGLRYRTGLTGWDFEFIMPSSSPVDFDPIALHKTLDFLRDQPFRWVYHSHFGRSEKEEAISETLRVGDAFDKLIREIYYPNLTLQETMDALRQWLLNDLHSRGLQPGSMERLDIDFTLDSLGLMHYIQQIKKTETQA